MNWRIERVEVSKLKEWHKNPRVLTKKGLEDLTKSIKKFGLAEPLVCNTDFTVCGGHGRLKVIKELGIDEIEVYVPERTLTEKQFEELNIRLNKNIAGQFDFDILANEFESDELIEWGFEEKELVGLFIEDKTDEELDGAPEPQKEAISQVGDIFLLGGKHRIMCGDSTKKEDVELLMNGKKADMVFTDPPFNVNYQDLKHKHRKIENDKMSEQDFESFLAIIYKTIPENSYVCCNWQSYPLFFNVAKLCGIPVKSCIVWDKIIPAQHLDKYYKQHEFVLYHGKFGGQKTLRGDVVQLKRQRSGLHPTVKPVELVEMFIDDGSYANDLVLDLFLGSGSTLIACEQTNRICYGMELDPIYIDVILKRYHKLYPDHKIECVNRDFDFSILFEETYND